jgi:hypothetical protein
LLPIAGRFPAAVRDLISDDAVFSLVDWPIIAGIGAYFPQFFAGKPPELILLARSRVLKTHG